MFGRRYFGGRHFGPRYFGDGGTGVAAAPTDRFEGGGGDPQRRRWRTSRTRGPLYKEPPPLVVTHEAPSRPVPAVHYTPPKPPAPRRPTPAVTMVAALAVQELNPALVTALMEDWRRKVARIEQDIDMLEDAIVVLAEVRYARG